MARFSYRLRVRYGECDRQGVVFNAHYFAYFDVVITEVWRHAGVPYQEMVAKGVDMMVAEAKARFRAPARFDDELELEWWATKLGNTSLISRIDVKRDGEVLVEGEMRHVFVDLGSGEKRPMPDDIRGAIQPYAEETIPAESDAAAEARA
jgi:acyl-CoA thioester hydrolase